MNPSPLDTKNTEPFRLVVTEDKRPARSVRNLGRNRTEVRRTSGRNGTIKGVIRRYAEV